MVLVLEVVVVVVIVMAVVLVVVVLISVVVVLVLSPILFSSRYIVNLKLGFFQWKVLTRQSNKRIKVEVFISRRPLHISKKIKPQSDLDCILDRYATFL